jgi:hypothetical protein
VSGKGKPSCGLGLPGQTDLLSSQAIKIDNIKGIQQAAISLRELVNGNFDTGRRMIKLTKTERLPKTASMQIRRPRALLVLSEVGFQGERYGRANLHQPPKKTGSTKAVSSPILSSSNTSAMASDSISKNFLLIVHVSLIMGGPSGVLPE